MPYDSNGNYTLPDSYFVENGDTVLPIQHNPPLEDIQAALSAVVLRSGVAPMSGDLKMGTKKITGMGDGAATTDAVTKGQLDLQSVRYVTKAANYTLVASDNDAVIRFTASATASLTAAATLGANWHAIIVADGGSVPIDPNGSETINGMTTLVVPNGSSCKIICDGSNFFTVIKPSLWEPVGAGRYTLSGDSSLNVTDIGAYRMIRISGALSPNAAAAGIFYRTSTNNGSSYDAGASDYSNQTFGAAGTGVGASTSNAAALALTNNSVLFVSFETIINGFGVIGNMSASSRVFTNLSVGGLTTELNGGQRNSSTARNALQIILGAGATSMTGTVLIEGVRA